MYITKRSLCYTSNLHPFTSTTSPKIQSHVTFLVPETVFCLYLELMFLYTELTTLRVRIVDSFLQMYL